MKVAFIGTGWANTVQIPAFQAGGLSVAGIYGRTRSKAETVAETHGVPFVADTWQDLLDLDCDLISVTSPPALHVEQASAVLAAGKHLLCEKPLTLTTAEAAVMRKLQQDYPDQLTLVDHELRFVPVRLKAKELLEQGVLGRILTITIRIARDLRMDPTKPWNWWSDASQGGGIMGAIGSHAIDGLLWLFAGVQADDGTPLANQLTMRGATLGQVHPTRATATGEVKPVTADDIASVTFNMGSAIGTMLIHGAALDGPIDLLTIRGTEGTLVLDNSLKLYWGKTDGPLKEYVTPLPDNVPNRFRSSPFAAGTVLLGEALAEASKDTSTPLTSHPRLANAATLADSANVQAHLDTIYKLGGVNAT
ncbi:MAG: Gfo/Idh/MocA family oxidoreductase [Deinococcota bacterium]